MRGYRGGIGGLDQADPGAVVHGLILVAVRRMRPASLCGPQEPTLLAKCFILK